MNETWIRILFAAAFTLLGWSAHGLYSLTDAPGKTCIKIQGEPFCIVERPHS